KSMPPGEKVAYNAKHMKSSFYHLQINISMKNLPFYKELMSELGWSVIFEMPDVIGYTSGGEGSLWFCQSQKPETSDYDARGVNHISIKVEKQRDVDQIVEFLKKKNV